ncbi:hypothetical protein [Novosphingobium sediminicola]|uniref:Uncharacterized protein n=1 Tax=Novosphingobium sediminicola TaxID=563162 RepID=A0A7W6CG72_9SPHN|nr:hypothetical protein [Novosphingobium sediminicola]MBB3955936.1 hypothetical protein [Novosphingobium sediminicola]
MCDPLTLTAAAAATAAIGTGVGAVQASSMANYRAQVADRNAALEMQAVQTEQENTRQAALDHYRKVAQLKGQQIVGAAANGVSVDFGTAADTVADTNMLAAEDANRIYRQGFQAVRNHDINAANYGAEASASRSDASGSLLKGAFDMGSTTLGAATQYSKLKAGMNLTNSARSAASGIRVTNGVTSGWGF